MNKTTIGGLEVLELPGDRSGAVCICFHGFGADHTDLLSLGQLGQITPRPTWLFPRGPLKITFATGVIGRAWFPIDMEKLHETRQQLGHLKLIDSAFPCELTESRHLIENFITELDTPLSKIFFGGFSQGAVLATEVALSVFERPGGLFVLSGTLVNKLHWEKMVHQKGGLPFFQSHGTNDPLLPFSRAQALETLFISGGLKGKLYSFVGGHEIPLQSLAQLDLFLRKCLLGQS